MFIVSAVSLFHNKEKTMQNNQLDKPQVGLCFKN